MTAAAGRRSSLDNLGKVHLWYTAAFIAFVVILGIAEDMGLSDAAIGYTYLGITIGFYAVIGIFSRTARVSEYYVPARTVPALFNGMATASDWMSAASFIGLAGTIFVLGHDGLAYVMGWTGGYVLLAVFIGPYLRKFGQFTIPDFLGARYGGNSVRTIGIIAAIAASFAYLIAQVTGVGIIVSRFLGLDFTAAVFVGLAGILVCSLLGGMKAVTWTQAAQYAILIVAYLLPPVVLSQKATGVPIPQVMYGQVLQRIDARERAIDRSPTEAAVRSLWKTEADRLGADIRALPGSLNTRRSDLLARLAALPADAPAADRARIREAISRLPGSTAAAQEAWSEARQAALGNSTPIRPHLQPFAQLDRKNMLALILCLMVGTAGLPHILMRYYTVPSVQDARRSVGWSLFFISLLYFTAPALAAFARHEVLSNVVGLPVAKLPAWVADWGRVGLVSFRDINADGVLQFHELTLGADAIVLALPEIAGLPYVISGLVAAGGLAAALTTADGLLLTISSALSHGLFDASGDGTSSLTRRLTVSRLLLLAIALSAAWVATFKLAIIVELVAWAFSIAAAALFPVLVMGIWDKRANRAGALAGMVIGLGACLFYLVGSRFFGLEWWGIRTVASGIFGIPLGFVAVYAVSRMTAAPPREMQDFVESVRFPGGADRAGPHGRLVP